MAMRAASPDEAALRRTADVTRGPVFQQEQLARAVQLGLGVAAPDQIRLVTDDAVSAAFARQVESKLHG